MTGRPTAAQAAPSTGPPPLPGGGRPRQWVIEIPAGTPLLSANGREHWAARARVIANLRSASTWLARAQRIPRLERAHVRAVYFPPDRRKRDPANLYPAVKAAIDGLTDAGVWADDDAQHLEGPDMRLGEACRPGGQLVLIILDLGGTT